MDLKSIVIEAVADVAGLELSNAAIIEIANLVEEKFTSTNSAMNAIAALKKNIVGNDSYTNGWNCAVDKVLHVLQQHQ